MLALAACGKHMKKLIRTRSGTGLPDSCVDFQFEKEIRLSRVDLIKSACRWRRKLPLGAADQESLLA
jgi:hypothetical protein